MGNGDANMRRPDTTTQVDPYSFFRRELQRFYQVLPTALGADACCERPLEDVMLDQIIHLGILGKDLEQAKMVVARIKSLEVSDTDAPALLGLPAAYWINLKGYDPVA